MKPIKITEDCIIYNDMPWGWKTGKDQPYWHYSLFNRWKQMWSRCKDPKHPRYNSYKDCEIDEKYRYLSNYVNDIMRLENFDKLCEDPSKYDIDKDKIDPNNRCYYFEYLSITTDSENTKERNNRCGNPNPYIKDFKPIRGINIDDGSILILMTKEELKKKGFRLSHINECLEGKRKSHCRYKWEFINE